MPRKLTKAELELLTPEEKKLMESLSEEELEELDIKDGLSIKDAYIHWETFLRGYGAQLSREKIYHLISKELLFIYTRVPLEKHMSSGTYAIENYETSQLEQFFIDYDVHIERRSLRDLLENETENMPDAENFFIRKGDYWTVGFAGETSTLKDSKGLRIVVVLLKNPNNKFYHSKLAALSEGGYENLSDDELENSDLILKMNKKVKKEDGDNEMSILEKEENLSLDDLPLEHLNSHDKKELAKIIFTLWNENNHGSDDWKKRWDEMKSHMRNEYGVIVKSTPKGPTLKFQHRLKKDEEKARQGNAKNIKRFIARIKNDMPKLHKHLDYNITPAALKPCYTVDSENSISWKIED